jgi:hypothetical protein
MTIRLYSIFVAVATLGVAPAFAQQSFDSSEAAAQALIDAVAQHDSARMFAILGPKAKGILTCGNTTQDREEQDEFARLATAKHRLEVSQLNPNRVVLAIGDQDWPFPVPIVQAKGKWAFDASETPAEMLARHIGADELDAIEICHGYVEAQMKYASEYREKDGMLKYAARLISTPGHHDGLYWEGESEALVPEGFAHADSKPYHGYFFRILKAQGPDAPGGAHNYTVKEKLVGGFGLVAWPAKYGVSGVHTFIVNQDGVVYEKDLAPVAGKAPTITSFDPDHSWQPVD